MALQLQHPYQPSWIADGWSEQWSFSISNIKEFVDCPSTKPKGCNLERKAWTNLNRIRTRVDRTRHFLYKIGAAYPHQNGDYGESQTVSHIISDCEIYKSPRGIPGLLDLDDENQLVKDGSSTVIFWIYTIERTVSCEPIRHRSKCFQFSASSFAQK